ncbi:hypothetical protein [Aurantiacibacter zhengii]|uniref:Uncharacterized protein n=1 Tax=Aurantiacibacter zhengii TaxID=2307003 RepID=A0A418NTX0_9SPHN|nr:hypothetical protein [Aurantiacibacter zhengii]RIV87493.1 hypothetical protein D2V07_03845 [Aurantiacibacter zhengii]
MGFLGGLLPGIGGLLFGGAAKLLGLGKSKQKRLPRPVQRDSAREEAEAQDDFRRRRGAAADMVTGAGGAEVGSGVGRVVSGS